MSPPLQIGAMSLVCVRAGRQPVQNGFRAPATLQGPLDRAFARARNAELSAVLTTLAVPMEVNRAAPGMPLPLKLYLSLYLYLYCLFRSSMHTVILCYMQSWKNPAFPTCRCSFIGHVNLDLRVSFKLWRLTAYLVDSEQGAGAQSSHHAGAGPSAGPADHRSPVAGAVLCYIFAPVNK